MVIRKPQFTLTFVLAAMAASILRADVYELKDGGSVVGDLVKRSDGGDFVIKTAEGVEVTLEREQLQRIAPRSDAADEYTARSRTTPDTPDGHRFLAKWCNEHGLTREGDLHLARVAELDPEDEAARRSLGYQQVGGRWLTHEQVMATRGMQLWEGKYRNRQDIAIRQRDNEGAAVSVDWFSKIRLWRGWLDSRRPDRVAEAQREIAAINDPEAVPALVRLLNDESEDWAFEMFLDALGRLDHPVAVQTLVAYSLDDDDMEVRAKCLDYLVNGQRAVSILPYVQALRSKDNVIVNRAGVALGRIGDPAAISPMIDALVTTHKYLVDNAPPGQIAAGFNPNGGGGGLQMGGNGPKTVEIDKENLGVQRALIKLSGIHDYDFDEKAWRRWYVDRQMREHVNSRRDE